MTGAIVAVTLLFRLGLVQETVVPAAATLVLTLISLTLFR